MTELSVIGLDGRALRDRMGNDFDNGTTVEVGSCLNEYVSTPRQYLTYKYNLTSGYGGRYSLNYMWDLDDCVSPAVDVPTDLEDDFLVLRVLFAIHESPEGEEWIAVDRGENSSPAESVSESEVRP